MLINKFKQSLWTSLLVIGLTCGLPLMPIAASNDCPHTMTQNSSNTSEICWETIHGDDNCVSTYLIKYFCITEDPERFTPDGTETFLNTITLSSEENCLDFESLFLDMSSHSEDANGCAGMWCALFYVDNDGREHRIGAILVNFDACAASGGQTGAGLAATVADCCD